LVWLAGFGGGFGWLWFSGLVLVFWLVFDWFWLVGWGCFWGLGQVLDFRIYFRGLVRPRVRLVNQSGFGFGFWFFVGW
jgi:hypothetical protein